ncbi:MAG: 4'-phosphopantetheinyl transferase superfamily protein [Pseudomonadota bacterium]|nr:4'-phosphopantetheinyl transferase superfamily protein [Pseudomonadota bacterium]
MSRNNSNQVSDFFAASSRDVTPVSVSHVADVLYAPVSHDPEVTRRCTLVLSDTELQRADRFVTQEDKTLFIQRRAFRRYCGALAHESSQSLSQMSFIETENGRPRLPDLPDYWFSFSSCRFGFVAAWSSTHGIGVDVEDHTRGLQATELAQQFFSTAEARAVDGSSGLESRQTFFKFWCLKEAALKSIGEGLPFGLDSFEFELEPNLRVVDAPPEHGGAEQFDARLIETTDSYTALLIRNLA